MIYLFPLMVKRAHSLAHHENVVSSGNQRPDAHRFYGRLGYQATGVRFVKSMLQEH